MSSPLQVLLWSRILCLFEARSQGVADLAAQVAEARAAVRRAEEELAQALEQEVAESRDASVISAMSSGAGACHARITAKSHGDAAQYLTAQHKLRAPYYLRSAWKRYEEGLYWGKRKDITNPFIMEYAGIVQVVAALELDSENATTWLEAGKVASALVTLSDNMHSQLEPLSLFSRACRMDPSLLPDLKSFLLRRYNWKLHPDERQMRRKIWKTVRGWIATGVVEEVEREAVPSITDGACSSRSSSAVAEEAPREEDADIHEVLKHFRMRSIFPTRIMQVNVKAHMPDGFLERLSDLCIRKFKAFGRKNPKLEPNDLNDEFFSSQVDQFDELKKPKNQKKWPEMYRDSNDFKLLMKLMDGILRSFLRQTHTAPEPSDEDAFVTLWAAVYPGNGGRHGYHVHQNSIVSCVIYLQTAGATTPIIFVDPRGAPPVNDYEQHMKERSFEPEAPFHHSEYLFPEPGDVVCFPSWLVHTVPSHREAKNRVAFAANLEQQDSWDSWHRTATKW